jgi:glycosyltransferase involved in cell wall biosynthesis
MSEHVVLAHAHVSSNGSFWRKAILLWVARRFGVPTIFHLHSGGFDAYASDSGGSALRRWCIRRTLESSTAVIVLSERWATWARGFAPKSHIRIVGNPVQVPAHATPPSGAEGETKGGGRVLYLGLICDAKGSFDLLQAWARFRARVPGWRLLVGGNGEVERFLAQAQRLGIRDDVDYLGWVSGAEKERVLSIADVFVLPSYKEGMPVSILEAMVHGAAVIATPVGGVPDMMVNERHGLLVDVGDADALADSLERMATLPELRERLTAQAREHVLANYSTQTVLSRLKAIYRETIPAAR